MLEQADRARKMAEQELSDTNETLADLTVQNQSLSSSKRKLEQDLADLRHEADEALNEARQMVSTTDFTVKSISRKISVYMYMISWKNPEEKYFP